MQPPPIRWTQHALVRLGDLQSLGFEIGQVDVQAVVSSPDIVLPGYEGRLIYQKRIMEEYVLRVICELSPDELVVVTLYPGRFERYG